MQGCTTGDQDKKSNHLKNVYRPIYFCNASHRINFEFNLIILHLGAVSLTSALSHGVNSPHGRLRCQTLSAHGSQHTHPGRHGLAPAYTQTHASTCTLTSVHEHQVDAQTAGTIQSRCHTPGVFFPPCQHTACELCHHSVDMLVTSSLPLISLSSRLSL